MRRILVIGRFSKEALAPLEQLQFDEQIQLEIGPSTLSTEELTARLAGEPEGLMGIVCRATSGARIDDGVLARVRRPFFIASASKGTDHIDLADSSGVTVFKPRGDGNASAVAELTVAKAIDLVRRVPLARAAMQRDELSNGAVAGARSLQGSEWTCLGKGAQVRKLARILPGLGITTLNIWAPTVDLPSLRECFRGAPLTELDVSLATDASEVQITYAVGDIAIQVRGMRQLDAALGSADVASIHLPYSPHPFGAWPKTEGLIDGARLRALKSGAMLINVSRGELVEEEDVIKALYDGHIGGYSTDVLYTDAEARRTLRSSKLGNLLWEQITGRAKKPLNLDITPHIGGSAEDVVTKMTHDVIDQLLEAISIVPPRRGGAHV